MHDLTRRDALKLGAAALPALAALRLPDRSFAQTLSPVPGIRKPLPPELFTPQGTNAEMRWSAMRGAGLITPVDRFFVRNHTVTPAIDPHTWRLGIFGAGLKGRQARTAPVVFTRRMLEKLDPVTITAAVECAGNGRNGFAQQGQKAAGTAWNMGAIGLATWRGVALRDVLERAGVTNRAVDIMPEGLDATVADASGVDQGHVRRPLPIAKALDDCIIAFEMNGQDLPADHGFPARLIVPGWVGVANTKWLGFIEVADTTLTSYWNTVQYRFVGPTYPVDSPPLTTQPLKSTFEIEPQTQYQVGEKIKLTGRAWSGGTRAEKVEVSTDNGSTWRTAALREPNKVHEWVRFSIDWTPTTSGATNLISRATDRKGRVQGPTQPFNTNGYEYAAYFRTPVTVL